MGKILNNHAAELEADKIAVQFMHSSDVVKDMSKAYNADFSNIKIHTDSAADAKVRAADRDAIASGTDIFFGKGILNNEPASKGLLAHELAHTMQQGIVDSNGGVSETVSAGAEQGGKIIDWFREMFTKEDYDPVLEQQQVVKGFAWPKFQWPTFKWPKLNKERLDKWREEKRLRELDPVLEQQTPRFGRMPRKKIPKIQ